MAPVDGSAVNIIIPVIQQDFHVQHLGKVAWVQLAYLIVIGGLILPMGRLGDLWGFRRIYLSGAVLFTVSSAICGLAPSLSWLIGARVLQAVGACMMMALSSGIITAIFPAEERGRALGVVGMCIAIGLVLGPTFGGFLVHLRGSWRWVFFINLPIGLFGGLWCARMLPPLRFGLRARVDWLGGVLAVTMLTALLLAITNGGPWGWISPAVLALLALSLTSAIAFIWQERRHPTPMLDLSLFRNRVFAGANLASMMNFLGQSCAVFLTPVLLENGFGYNTAKAGMVIAAVPLGVMLLAPISGSLSDRIGTRGLAAAGESVVAVGLAGMAVLLHGIGAGTHRAGARAAVRPVHAAARRHRHRAVPVAEQQRHHGQRAAHTPGHRRRHPGHHADPGHGFRHRRQFRRRRHRDAQTGVRVRRGAGELCRSFTTSAPALPSAPFSSFSARSPACSGRIAP